MLKSGRITRSENSKPDVIAVALAVALWEEMSYTYSYSSFTERGDDDLHIIPDMEYTV